MDTLIVLRHAKSDWSNWSGGDPDHDRPLAPRGRRQAPEAGRWLAAHAEPIDLAVVSTAVRAQQTWALASAELSVVPERVDEERAYGASGDALAAIVEEYADRATVVLVSHNPGVEDLVHQLTGEWVALPTSAIAVIDMAAGRLVASGRPPR